MRHHLRTRVLAHPERRCLASYLRQRAARSEREGVRQLHHAKFLQNKHEEALKEAASKDRTDEAGTLCPVCLQIVDEGLLMVCGHFFCSGCTDKLLAEPRATCGICRAKISKRSLFRVSGNAAISTDATAGDTTAAPRAPPPGRSGRTPPPGSDASPTAPPRPGARPAPTSPGRARSPRSPRA